MTRIFRSDQLKYRIKTDVSRASLKSKNSQNDWNSPGKTLFIRLWIMGKNAGFTANCTYRVHYGLITRGCN